MLKCHPSFQHHPQPAAADKLLLTYVRPSKIGTPPGQSGTGVSQEAPRKLIWSFDSDHHAARICVHSRICLYCLIWHLNAHDDFGNLLHHLGQLGYLPHVQDAKHQEGAGLNERSRDITWHNAASSLLSWSDTGSCTTARVEKIHMDMCTCVTSKEIRGTER